MIKGSGKEWSSTQGWHQQDDVTILCWKGRETRVLLKIKKIFSKERMDASAGVGSVGWRIQPLLKLWPDRLGLREGIL